jgi:phosphoribosylpyrophosphate synthetase
VATVEAVTLALHRTHQLGSSELVLVPYPGHTAGSAGLLLELLDAVAVLTPLCEQLGVTVSVQQLLQRTTTAVQRSRDPGCKALQAVLTGEQSSISASAAILGDSSGKAVIAAVDDVIDTGCSRDIACQLL